MKTLLTSRQSEEIVETERAAVSPFVAIGYINVARTWADERCDAEQRRLAESRPAEEMLLGNCFQNRNLGESKYMYQHCTNILALSNHVSVTKYYYC